MNLGTFAGIFALMFVLELPDKTFIAMVVMSSRVRPLMLLIGGSVALTIQMGLAVGAGSLLTLFPAHLKDVIVAALFLVGAALLLFVPEKKEEEEGKREGEIAKPDTRWKEISTAFVVMFVGEFGDLTQIQAANFEAKLHQPLEVFLASSIALIMVCAVGAYGGLALQRVIPLAKIRIGGGLIFAGLGIYTLVSLAMS
ncbi:MAG: TMEM165/GDT1 family protein [Acidimicrobiaceae bacterium]|nr:TMEM165/GDT1 family protein [Acidimicrobiaceae bacterium]